MISYNDFVKNSKLVKYQYNQKVVKKYIIIINHSKSEPKINKNKLELFNLMSNVVIKQINNFQKLTKNFRNQELETQDLISEFYIVLDKCARNFQWRWNTNFYFYYNMALNKLVQRLYEKYYLKTQSQYKGNIDDGKSKTFRGRNYVQVYSIDDENSNIMDEIFGDFHFDMLDFDLKNIGFSTEMIDIINSRIAGEKIGDYIIRKGIDSNNYYRIFNEIKEIISKTYNYESV